MPVRTTRDRAEHALSTPAGRIKGRIFPTRLREQPTLVLHVACPANGVTLSPLAPLPTKSPDYVSTYQVFNGLYVLPTGDAMAPSLHIVAEASLETPELVGQPYHSTSVVLQWLEDCLPADFLTGVIDEVVQAYLAGDPWPNRTHPIPDDSRELFYHVRQHFKRQTETRTDPRRSSCPREWFLLGAPDEPTGSSPTP